MKKSLKIGLALAVCLVLVLAAFAAYKVYRHFEWNNFLINEKLDNISGAFEGLLYYANNYPIEVEHYTFDYSWAEQNPVLIAHALGGIDGISYTNSLEALELAYEKGLRVFEADFQVVDGELLLLHDLTEAAEMCGFESQDFSSEDFLEASLYGEYSPMSWRQLLSFMQEHPDAYVVTDTKYYEQPYMSYVVSALVTQTVELDESLLDRVIVQVYSHHMLDTVMDIYPFKSAVFTLYMSPDDDEKVRAFCAKSGIEAVTMPQSRCTEEFVASLDAMGIYTFVHTINDPQQAGLLLESGVTGLYTDFLTPADFAQG